MQTPQRVNIQGPRTMQKKSLVFLKLRNMKYHFSLTTLAKTNKWNIPMLSNPAISCTSSRIINGYNILRDNCQSISKALEMCLAFVSSVKHSRIPWGVAGEPERWCVFPALWCSLLDFWLQQLCRMWGSLGKDQVWGGRRYKAFTGPATQSH